jgi:NTP pyrophosphatase (non-canonical NTP hydrolase)
MILNFDEMLKQMQEDSDRWFGPNIHNNLTIMTLGLGGETGEVLDIVKKLARGSLSMGEATALLEEELVDVFHYWLMLIGMLHVDVQAIYDRKREYNERRWGDGNKGVGTYSGPNT